MLTPIVLHGIICRYVIREICQETVQIMKRPRNCQIKAPENLLKQRKCVFSKFVLMYFKQ